VSNDDGWWIAVMLASLAAVSAHTFAFAKRPKRAISLHLALYLVVQVVSWAILLRDMFAWPAVIGVVWGALLWVHAAEDRRVIMPEPMVAAQPYMLQTFAAPEPRRASTEGLTIDDFLPLTPKDVSPAEYPLAEPTIGSGVGRA
jgi:hypothetical protein